MPVSAIILGSTGLVGNKLLHLLLDDDRFSSVKIFIRRPISIEHKKLSKVITDFTNMDALKDEVHADVIFSCLGSTKKKTPDKEAYYRVDHSIPVWFAGEGKKNGASQFHIVSALGANAGSSNFYLKLKGETERDIRAVGIPTLCIYRPSLITGERQEKRLMETMTKYIMKVFDPLLAGGLRKYRSIAAGTIALAMRNRSLQQEPGTFIYEHTDIKRLAGD